MFQPPKDHYLTKLRLETGCESLRGSKPSSDSHRSLTDLEHVAVNGDSPSILASLWDPPPGWLCPSEF